MQHVHCVADVDEQDQGDQKELCDVDKSLQDESHVEGRAVKESKPVHYRLHSLTDQHKRAQIPFHIHACCLNRCHIVNDDPGCAEILE